MSDPIPMLLWCPECRARHIDEGEFAAKIHHTHACQICGMVWRPAVVPTVGVRFLPGFKNKPSLEVEALNAAGAALAAQVRAEGSTAEERIARVLAEPYEVGVRLARVYPDGGPVWFGEITQEDPGPLFHVTPDDGGDAQVHTREELDRLFRRDPHEARVAAPVVPDLEVPAPKPALRVGMTYAEFDELRLGCDGEDPACTVGAPCTGCAFHEAALCSCGHSSTSHHSATLCEDCDGGKCPGFFLASWQGGPGAPSGDRPACLAEPALADPAGAPRCPDCSAVGRWKALAWRCPTYGCRWFNANLEEAPEPSPVAAAPSTPVARRRAWDPREPTAPLRSGRPRITPWPSTPEGQAAIAKMREAVADAEPRGPWLRGALRRAAGISTHDAKRALWVLETAGEVANKGKLYGPPGFTAWPVPKGKKPAVSGDDRVRQILDEEARAAAALEARLADAERREEESWAAEDAFEEGGTDDPIGRSCSQVDLQMGDDTPASGPRAQAGEAVSA